MSEGAAEHAVVDAEPAQRISSSEAPERESEPRRHSRHHVRFAIVYVALAVVAGVGVGAFAVLLTKPDAGPEAPWSTWQPTGSDEASAKQIADRIAGRYKLADGRQLAAALVGPAQVSGNAETGDIPVRAIAVRPDTSTGLAEEDDVDIVTADSNLMFVLCGLGAACSIASGKPSEARHMLLRRESLELALYSFKYVGSVDSVTVFLPPNPDGQTAPTAIFLRRGDVERELRKPLGETLGPKVPFVGQMTGSELAAVNRVTGERLFTYEYQQVQDGSAILVLDPVVAA